MVDQQKSPALTLAKRNRHPPEEQEQRLGRAQVFLHLARLIPIHPSHFNHLISHIRLTWGVKWKQDE